MLRRVVAAVEAHAAHHRDRFGVRPLRHVDVLRRARRRGLRDARGDRAQRRAHRAGVRVVAARAVDEDRLRDVAVDAVAVRVDEARVRRIDAAVLHLALAPVRRQAHGHAEVAVQVDVAARARPRAVGRRRPGVDDDAAVEGGRRTARRRVGTIGAGRGGVDAIELLRIARPEAVADAGVEAIAHRAAGRARELRHAVERRIAVRLRGARRVVRRVDALVGVRVARVVGARDAVVAVHRLARGDAEASQAGDAAIALAHVGPGAVAVVDARRAELARVGGVAARASGGVMTAVVVAERRVVRRRAAARRRPVVPEPPSTKPSVSSLPPAQPAAKIAASEIMRERRMRLPPSK